MSVLIPQTDDKTYSDFVDDEKAGQLLLDKWYADKGWTVDRTEACIGYDGVLSGRFDPITVEEKIVKWPDCIVEFLQDIADYNNKGWFYTTTADMIVWAWVTDGRLRAVSRVGACEFKQWIKNDWHEIKPRAILSRRGLGATLCLLPSPSWLAKCPTFKREEVDG